MVIFRDFNVRKGKQVADFMNWFFGVVKLN